jgi:predicted nucleotidyltransferase
MGSKIPKMGTPLSNDRSASLADALFPRTRQRVLAAFFGQPDRAFGIVELIGLVGAGSGAVQREIERLVRSGLVSVTAAVPHKRYQANRTSPIYDELRSIVEKTAGIPQVLRAALEPMRARILFAVLYGSVAKAKDTAASDIDVLVVGRELALEDIFQVLEPAEQRLRRRISPTLYSPEEFLKRRRAKNPFLTKVLGGKHVVLMGAENALAAAG